MNKYFYDDNKYILLIIIAVMFLLLFVIAITILYQVICCGVFNVIVLFVFALCLATLYFLLFLSVLKEKYSSIEFDNEGKYITLYGKYTEKLKIPYEQIKLIKFSRGACIRYIYFTKIEIFTDYARYKITLKKDIHNTNPLIKELQDILPLKYHNTILLLP